MVLGLAACAPKEEPAPAEQKTLNGVGEGFGGEIKATVVMEGDKIISVEVVGDKETKGIGTPALEQLPALIVAANSTEVDVISGATYTSEGIIYAVNNAMDPVKFPAPVAEAPAAPGDIVAAEAYLGFGVSKLGRKGPGKDDKDVQVWSFNQVFTTAIFDGDGKILDINIDQLEVATPNYDGDGMPHLSGFPGQGGYNYDENHDEKVDSMTPDTQEQFFAEIEGWKTKRERGEAYVMGNGKTWTEQIEGYEAVFVGKTVAEVEEWFTKYTSDLNGRALKDGSDKPEDKAKYDALTAEEKAMLADVTSSATMSLKDGHGNIVESIKLAYENRKPLEIEEATGFGFGIVSTPRKGPGADDKDVQVWSINEVFVTALFDADGKIAAIHIDQLEIATPNYDGDGMPHFSGYPGQGGYNYDENHDEKVDGMTADTEENFFAEIEGWKTKRERGEAYVMGNGKTWTEQIEGYEAIFVGKTVEEVEEWFNKYTSDLNGRALKDGSDKPEDKAKYDALTAEEKAMLADVTSSATMSLKDSHGDIIAAIKAAFANKQHIVLQIGK
jgi:uncharacterized protein with FMN-binding domain